MTQLEAARAGQVTPQMTRVAEREGVDAAAIMAGVAEGRIVIPANVNHTNLDPAGIGEGLRIKVNANLGTSSSITDIEDELAKLVAAVEAGADAVMDLSSAGDLDAIRRRLLAECTLPFGSVPIYQAAVEAVQRDGRITAMTPDGIFDVIRRHAESGVDFLTVHCGVTREAVRLLQESNRVAGSVSRGGTFLACWMLANDAENPLYEEFDRLLEIAREFDATLSLGDGMRPGAIADATDKPQVHELVVLGELVERARRAGVQAMVEGPGHVPLDQVAGNVVMEKQVCRGAPFYVLGPIVTDIAPGYDHITSSIGGALAGMAGADFLCYVTPSEHLALPTARDVREGVMAARIAAHAADIVRLGARAASHDEAMSRARRDLDWEAQFRLALDPARARELHARAGGGDAGACSMCGEYCVFKLLAPKEREAAPS